MAADVDALRFGVYLPAYVLSGEPAPGAAFLQDFARRAEDLGFDSLWVIDHLFESPPSYRAVFMEPITSLSLVVGATRRITLGTGILVLPLQNPVLVAKSFANLDAASEGRVILGVAHAPGRRRRASWKAGRWFAGRRGRRDAIRPESGLPTRTICTSIRRRRPTGSARFSGGSATTRMRKPRRSI
jgi:alkanesulfonate monooxygenase SsuD/methylene tetrahydromethanopterin reductase-like flavin-dependent oxidoreductase (luciferase family)